MTESYWRDTAPTTRTESVDSMPDRVDVLVVGAGYTGLSVATHLARAGADVAVIDMCGVGAGASARNGGIVAQGVLTVC